MRCRLVNDCGISGLYIIETKKTCVLKQQSLRNRWFIERVDSEWLNLNREVITKPEEP